MSRDSALRIRAQAFRWALLLIAGCFLLVGLAFLGAIPVAVAYWVGLALGLLAIGAMAVYFVTHRESRQ